jgi:ABC-type transport system involved in multi-copper enzyme maturation permease subunit
MNMDSLRRIFLIAHNTFRESVRDRVLYTILFVAIALAAFSILLGEWSVFDRVYTIQSVTLALISLSGMLITVFLGISLVQKEIQRRTVFNLLAKPVRRGEFLLGKYAGLLAVVLVHVLVLTGVMALSLAFVGAPWNAGLAQAVFLIFMELSVVLAIAVCFSSFSSGLLSALFTLGVYAIGHLSQQILDQVQFAYRVAEDGSLMRLHGQFIYDIAKAVHWVWPGLYRFGVGEQAVHHLPIPASYLAWNSLYALGFSVIFLGIAALWFRKRDFI